MLGGGGEEEQSERWCKKMDGWMTIKFVSKSMDLTRKPGNHTLL